MKNRFALCVAASLAFLGSAAAALAAEPDTDPTPAASAVATDTAATQTTGTDTSGTIAAVTTATPTIAAVRPAMAEVFRPAPVPGDEERSPTRRVADAGPNLHPDFLSVHEKSDGPLGDTDLAYNRNERMKPAGGMSLDIPMQ